MHLFRNKSTFWRQQNWHNWLNMRANIKDDHKLDTIFDNTFDRVEKPIFDVYPERTPP